MLISNQYIIRLFKAELILLAFSIPIYQKVIPYIIASIVITWLLEGDFGGKARRIANDRHRLETLLFAGIYVLYGIGLLYSENFDYGYFDMEVKMSLLIFPVLLSTFRKEVLSEATARKVLWAFVFGVLASFTLCYSQAIYQYFERDTLVVFYYSSLSPLIHPSYLAMYVSFAIAILMYFMLKGMIKGRIKRALAILLVGIFELFLVMLSSKAGILGLVLTIAMFTSYIIFIEKRITLGLLTGGLLTATFLILFLLFPTSAERFRESSDDLGMKNVKTDVITSSTTDRIMIWWYSFEITNENFFSGIGTGDVKDQLLDKYEEKDMSHARELELNAHNQYLQTMIALGIVGLVILLLNLILPALYSVEIKHYLYLIFLLLVGFNFLFESMLETQAGVVFYAFFNAFLFAIKKDPASKEAGSQD